MNFPIYKEFLKVIEKDNTFYFFLVLVFFLFSCDKGTTTRVPPESIEPALLHKALDALVVVEIEDKDGKQRFGSGFFVNRGLIATCFHVIDGATSGTVKLVRSELKSHIRDVIVDEQYGLALLVVTDFGVPFLSFSDSNSVEIGKTVWVVGNSQVNWEDEVTREDKAEFFEGIITLSDISSNILEQSTVESLRRRIGNQIFLPDKVFQISARIQPGGGGGPVLNTRGEVVGISFKTFEETRFLGNLEEPEVLNFVIPSNYLQALISQWELEKPLDEGQSISAHTYYLRGEAKLNRYEYEAALTDFNEAIRLKSDYPEAYYKRGNAKYMLGQFGCC